MTRIYDWYASLDMTEFAGRLKLLREARNLTQARLADLLSIDPRAYNRWERGSSTPQLETLIKIADVLQVTLDELVGRKPPSEEVKLKNFELHTLCQQADNLPDADQQALILVIDSFVKKSQMAKVMGKAAKG